MRRGEKGTETHRPPFQDIGVPRDVREGCRKVPLELGLPATGRIIRKAKLTRLVELVLVVILPAPGGLRRWASDGNLGGRRLRRGLAKSNRPVLGHLRT